MNGQFFRMMTDVDVPNRWHLGIPVDIKTEQGVDTNLFTQGQAVSNITALRMPLQYSGRSLDITFAGFHVPIITQSVANVLLPKARSNIELIPIDVENSSSTYYILNITTVLDCLDRKKSMIQWWTETDNRPEKTGKPRMIIDLRIEPCKARNTEIFRLFDWEVAIIVSKRLKEAIEAAGFQGVKFEEV